MMLRLKSLQQRLAIFMLLPVAVLLIAMGVAGMVYARRFLLTQLGEATVLKLQRAAHHVDMALARPKELLHLLFASAELTDGAYVQDVILAQLKQQEGVADVRLRWNNPPPIPRMPMGRMQHRMRRQHHAEVAVVPPIYNTELGHETVALVSQIVDEAGLPVGRLDVDLRFDHLFSAMETIGIGQGHVAYLVDASGRILSESLSGKIGKRVDPSADGRSVDARVRAAIEQRDSGIEVDHDAPSARVIGFYKLTEAPWTLVIIAPGSQVMAPVIRFQVTYLTCGIVFGLIILLLIRSVTGRTVNDIRQVSRAARLVAEGDYRIVLPAQSHDEVGELVESFGTMVAQLEERTKIKDSLALAKEVQQNLLPRHDPRLAHLDIAGTSSYCEETGGDYYDFIALGDPDQGRMLVTVGDVADHGVAAALLMATARALIRSRAQHDARLDRMITDVNRLLCHDTGASGNFMTVFAVLLDAADSRLDWVRAGHDPALLFDKKNDHFVELGGKGIALGLDADHDYDQHRLTGWGEDQILLIGTDGIWETANASGERFGKRRLHDILRRHADDTSRQIVEAVMEGLGAFRGQAAQDDDITLVVIQSKG